MVFLLIPPDVRMTRIRARERDRYGDAILPGGRMHDQYVEFLTWAEQYDEGPPTMRSRSAHEAWLAALPCPVLRLEGVGSVPEHVEAILRYPA